MTSSELTEMIASDHSKSKAAARKALADLLSAIASAASRGADRDLLPWICSLNDLGWRKHGFEGRSLTRDR